ncbi:MAG TPA: MFS transporter [Gaiellales bacterium]|nr:MFS transporter [Gaiellales bacterium]
MTTLAQPDDGAQSAGRWLVRAIVCLAQFMVVLDATVVNVALPTLQRDLHFSAGSLQWVVNAYTLLFGGFLLLGGRAADLFGRRRLFLAGLVAFTAASMIDGLAPSSGALIAARALQGLGAAMVSPAALAIVTTSFPDGRPRTRAMGVWAAIAVGGGAIGLLLGGILTEYASWRWIFFVNVPVGVLAFALALRLVPESRGSGVRRGFDLPGAAAITGGLVLLVFGIVKAQQYGWASLRTVALVGAAVLLIAAFVAIERRSSHPLVRLGIFRTRSLAAGNAVMMVVAGGMFAIFFFATLYVQEILHLSPVQAGLGFLPLTAAIILASGAAQQMIARVGVRAVAVTGMGTAAAGLLLLARTPTAGSYAADVLPGLVVMGFGLGLVFVPMTLIATTNVADADAGLASGLFNTSQQVGGALGLAILSTLAADRTSSRLSGLGHAPSPAGIAGALVDGYHVAFMAGAGLMLIGAVVAVSQIRGSDVSAIDEAGPGDAGTADLQPAFESDDGA